MKRTKLKLLILFAAVCAISLLSEATTWKVTRWSGWRNWGSDEENRFVTAVNKAQDGDIIELQNDLTVNADVQIYDNITVRSKEGNTFSIYNKGQTYGVKIHPGATLAMSNVVYDCEDMSQVEDVFLLMPKEVTRNSVTNIARMILNDGAIIKNAHLTSNSDSENAVIHVKTGAVFRINAGAAILNCKNESSPGKGGAICCDFGTVIMTGGTIAGCTAKGAGGAIHTDGTRVDSADHYGISERGDIYISGGYITNNTCGAGLYGGGIYLGNSGPVLHITGTAVISNNFSGTIPDDVSTYNLENAYANRLKLVDYHESHPEGFTYAGQLFTGWVGVRYPSTEEMTDPQHIRFGAVWEYFDGHDEEARQFFWNGNNSYRGKIDGNSLVWSSHVVHELPKDEIKIAELIATGESPIYCELTTNYVMEQTAYLPAGCQIIIDLWGHDLECDFHVTNETSQVVIRDSSTMKSGTVTGHRESEFDTAFVLEGGSYHTLPKPEWVASNRVVIGNYCTNHPYMVAIKVWDAEHERVVTDLTKVPLNESHTEVREAVKAYGSLDIGKITFSTGDWEFMKYTNANLRVQVLAAPAISNETTGVFEETGSRIILFDSMYRSGDAFNFGQEDEFTWAAAASRGLVKLLHITMEAQGELYVTNDIQVAYFKFPPVAFEATQRKTGGQLPITVVDALLNSFGYNRAGGITEDDENAVNGMLDGWQGNGLRKWENLVTGTDENQLLLSTVTESDNGLTLNIALSDADKTGRTDTGYHVRYDLRKYDNGKWNRVGEIMESPRFSVPLLDEANKSVDASGFYRVTTLIVPDKTLSVTNEIPSTNIVGVLEVASVFTNTLTAVPWVSLATDPKDADVKPMMVSKYLHTSHIKHNDSVHVADKGHIYRKWHWNKNDRKWEGATTVTRSAVEAAPPADEHALDRNSAVWVMRDDPAAKPFFLIGQYSANAVKLTIEAGTADKPACTLVPNPSLSAVKVNDYGWGDNPAAGDIIRIPNEKSIPVVLRWKNGAWGRYVYNPETLKSEWKTDQAVSAGTGFWYHRCGEAFQIDLPQDIIEGGN